MNRLAAVAIAGFLWIGGAGIRAQSPDTVQATAATATVSSATPAPTVPDSTGVAPGVNAGTGVDLTWPAPADPTKVTATELVQNVAHNKISINLVWTLLAGFLVMFMQAGFALVETGLCRAKNAAHVMTTNFLIYSLGMLGFWICGYAIMFGGYWNGPVAIGWQPTLGQGLAVLNHEVSFTLFGKTFGLMGAKGFFLTPRVFDTAVMTLFLFQMVFMDTTATIPTGSMAERWNIKNFLIYGFWVGMLPYAFYGNWVWGGGWLAQLGMNFHLGHGHVDFAGSSVVHMTGGVIALAGAALIGPRIGKFGPDGKPRAILGHDLPMVMLGTFILAFGWFGFNPGSTLAGTDGRIAVAAVNTMLASAAGAFVTSMVMIALYGKPDPSMMCNGMLAALVAITAPCAFVTPVAAVLIGSISGGLVVASVIFVERVLRVDDPVGAISVHGVNGAWGVLSLGLFANGSYGAGWNGVHKLFKDGVVQIITNDGSAETVKKYTALLAHGWSDQGVTGAFGTLFGAAHSDFSQLGAQCIGIVTNIVFIGAFAFVWFKFSNKIFPLRSKREDEILGLDVPEMGVPAYPEFGLTGNDGSKL